MKILLLTTEVSGAGGIQYVGRLLSRALRDGLGTDSAVTLVTIKDHEPISLTDLSGCRVFVGGGSRVRTSLTTWHLLRREPWDLVVLGHLNLAPLLLVVRRHRLPPLLAIIHGMEAWQPLSRLRRRGLSRADRLLYVSDYSRLRSENTNPWLQALPSSICPWGLLPAETASSRPPMPPGGPFALMIGRMAQSERYKGQEEMIRVWSAVQQHRPGLRLVLIGDGDDRPRLEALAREQGADVTFLGRVEDGVRDAYLSACRCFCLPSRGEGFGLVYLEAMRAGKPVLTSNQDAGAEVIVDGVTGRAVDPADPDEMLRGILELTGPRAEAMGQAGRECFQEQFCYEHFVRRLMGQVEMVRNRVGATV